MLVNEVPQEKQNFAVLLDLQTAEDTDLIDDYFESPEVRHSAVPPEELGLGKHLPQLDNLPPELIPQTFLHDSDYCLDAEDDGLRIMLDELDFDVPVAELAVPKDPSFPLDRFGEYPSAWVEPTFAPSLIPLTLNFYQIMQTLPDLFELAASPACLGFPIEFQIIGDMQEGFLDVEQHLADDLWVLDDDVALVGLFLFLLDLFALVGCLPHALLVGVLVLQALVQGFVFITVKYFLLFQVLALGELGLFHFDHTVAVFAIANICGPPDPGDLTGLLAQQYLHVIDLHMQLHRTCMILLPDGRLEHSESFLVLLPGFVEVTQYEIVLNGLMFRIVDELPQKHEDLFLMVGDMLEDLLIQLSQLINFLQFLLLAQMLDFLVLILIVLDQIAMQTRLIEMIIGIAALSCCTPIVDNTDVQHLDELNFQIIQ